MPQPPLIEPSEPSVVIELRNNPHCKNGDRYRYWMHRPIPGPAWNGTLVVVMLNPSTADEERDDATTRRVIAFATSGGYADVVVVNLFATRSTQPSWLRDLIRRDGLEATIGPGNDVAMRVALLRADDILLAWGADPAALQALPPLRTIVDTFSEVRGKLYALGLTKSGQPRHPLYVASTAHLRPYAMTGGTP